MLVSKTGAKPVSQMGSGVAAGMLVRYVVFVWCRKSNFQIYQKSMIDIMVTLVLSTLLRIHAIKSNVSRYVNTFLLYGLSCS